LYVFVHLGFVEELRRVCVVLVVVPYKQVEVQGLDLLLASPESDHAGGQ
jgi:hypothetical protein